MVINRLAAMRQQNSILLTTLNTKSNPNDIVSQKLHNTSVPSPEHFVAKHCNMCVSIKLSVRTLVSTVINISVSYNNV